MRHHESTFEEGNCSEKELDLDFSEDAIDDPDLIESVAGDEARGIQEDTRPRLIEVSFTFLTTLGERKTLAENFS